MGENEDCGGGDVESGDIGVVVCDCRGDEGIDVEWELDGMARVDQMRLEIKMWMSRCVVMS